MQSLFVLSHPWPILLPYIDIDAIASFCFVLLCFLFIYVIQVLPDSCQFLYQSMLWTTEPRENFLYIINLHTNVRPSLCYNFFCLTVLAKGCKRDHSKENKITRLMLVWFPNIMLVKNYNLLLEIWKNLISWFSI